MVARVAIEHQPLPAWRDKALAEKRPAATIEAMLALTRAARKELQREVLGRLNALPFKQLAEELTETPTDAQ